MGKGRHKYQCAGRSWRALGLCCLVWFCYPKPFGAFRKLLPFLQCETCQLSLLVLEFLLLVHYSLSDQWDPKLRKSKKWGVLKKCLLKPKHFSKFVLLHSHCPTENDFYVGPWPAWDSGCMTPSQQDLTDTATSSACPARSSRADMGQGGEGFPNGRGQIQSCSALSPSHLLRGVCGSLVNLNAFNANAGCTMKRNVLLVCRICTIYSNISNLPKQISPL